MYKYANNAVASLQSPIGPSDTSLTLISGQGAAFPSLSSGDTFLMTLVDTATKSQIEIVLVTATTGDTFTVVRAQDGTSAKSYLAGDIASQRITALELRDFASKQYGGTFQSTIYAPTAATGDNSGKVSTTAFVQQAIASIAPTATPQQGVTSFNSRTGAVTAQSSDVTSALGYTPYSNSNPSNYVASSSLSLYALLSGATFSALTVANNYFRIAPASNGFAYVEIKSPHLRFYKQTGGYSYYWSRSDDGTAGGANGAQMMELADTGNLTTAGLMFGRSGGNGLGRVYRQPVGSAIPSDIAEGDIVLQY